MRKDNYSFYIIALMAVIAFAMMTILAFAEERTSDFPTSARSATLYQPETKTFLYTKNADRRMPMASTTKIMTAIVAIETTSLDEIVEIGPESVGIEGSSAYLKVGEALTMEELLYALLLQSANDAAVAIAYHVGKDIESFADLMNKKADELGLTNTHFTNPHGLDDPDHYTSARDLAILTANALNNSDFRTICSTYKKCFIKDDRRRTYINHNKLLQSYEGCIGVKTGYTKISGRCLVSAAERDGLTFISVTLDDSADWADHKQMLNYGFQKLKRVDLCTVDEYCYEIPIINGAKSHLRVANQNASYVIVENAGVIKEHIKLAKYATAPINAGDIYGEIIYTVDNEEIARVNLVASESVECKSKNKLLDKLLSIFK